MKWRLKTDSGCPNQFKALDSQALWEFFFRQDAVAGLVKLLNSLNWLNHCSYLKTPQCYTDKIKRRWEASAIASEGISEAASRMNEIINSIFLSHCKSQHTDVFK